MAAGGGGSGSGSGSDGFDGVKWANKFSKVGTSIYKAREDLETLLVEAWKEISTTYSSALDNVALFVDPQEHLDKYFRGIVDCLDSGSFPRRPRDDEILNMVLNLLKALARVSPELVLSLAWNCLGMETVIDDNEAVERTWSQLQDQTPQLTIPVEGPRVVRDLCCLWWAEETKPLFLAELSKPLAESPRKLLQELHDLFDEKICELKYTSVFDDEEILDLIPLAVMLKILSLLLTPEEARLVRKAEEAHKAKAKEEARKAEELKILSLLLSLPTPPAAPAPAPAAGSKRYRTDDEEPHTKRRTA